MGILFVGTRCQFTLSSTIMGLPIYLGTDCLPLFKYIMIHFRTTYINQFAAVQKPSFPKLYKNYNYSFIFACMNFPPSLLFECFLCVKYILSYVSICSVINLLQALYLSMCELSHIFTILSLHSMFTNSVMLTLDSCPVSITCVARLDINMFGFQKFLKLVVI